MNITIQELLKRAVEMDASDLHITTYVPPRVRIHGSLVSLDYPPMTASETKSLAYSVLTDRQKKQFEDKMELDFSFGIDKLGRFRGNVLAIPGRWDGEARRVVPGRTSRERKRGGALPGHGSSRPGGPGSGRCLVGYPGGRDARFRGNAAQGGLRLRPGRREPRRPVAEHRPARPQHSTRHPPCPDAARPRLRISGLHPHAIPACPPPPALAARWRHQPGQHPHAVQLMPISA